MVGRQRPIIPRKVLAGARVFFPILAILMVGALLRSGIREARLENEELEESVSKVNFPDRCYLDIQLTDLNPDLRTVNLDVQEIFLPYGSMDFGDPGVLAAEKGRCAQEYSKIEKQIAPIVYSPDLDKKFGPVMMFDYYGRLSAARFAGETEEDEGTWPTTARHVKDLHLVLSGSPFFYPFDEYLIDFDVIATMNVLDDDKSHHYPIWMNTVAVHEIFPGFVVKATTISKEEEARQYSPTGTLVIINEAAENATRTRITVARPRSLKAMALLIGFLSVGSAIWVLLLSERRNLFRNAGGYFLTLWALRSVLSNSAPRTVTLVDYLFVALVVFVALAALPGMINGDSDLRPEPELHEDSNWE
jgi:hypothetical protein